MYMRVITVLIALFWLDVITGTIRASRASTCTVSWSFTCTITWVTAFAPFTPRGPAFYVNMCVYVSISVCRVVTLVFGFGTFLIPAWTWLVVITDASSRSGIDHGTACTFSRSWLCCLLTTCGSTRCPVTPSGPLACLCCTNRKASKGS